MREQMLARKTANGEFELVDEGEGSGIPALVEVRVITGWPLEDDLVTPFQAPFVTWRQTHYVKLLSVADQTADGFVTVRVAIMPLDQVHWYLKYL